MFVRLQWLFLFLLVILAAGCRREDPNPELLDPIYSDLSKQEKDDAQILEAQRKALVTAHKAEADALPQTIDLSNARRDITKAEEKITLLEQQMLYDHIRTERRKVEDHLNYHLAFVANKEWPSKEEYTEYLTNRRLREAPRDWDAHLPKNSNRKPASKPQKKSPEGEE